MAKTFKKAIGEAEKKRLKTFEIFIDPRIRDSHRQTKTTGISGMPKMQVSLTPCIPGVVEMMDRTRFINDEWKLPIWEGKMAIESKDTPFLKMFESEEREPKEVHIIPMDNGFVINIGCAHFVETSWARISRALELYFRDPVAAKKKYWEKK